MCCRRVRMRLSVQARTLHVVQAHRVGRVGWGKVAFDRDLVEVCAEGGFVGAAEVVEDE